MEFSIPAEVSRDLDDFESFLDTHLAPQLAKWYQDEALPREFFQEMGREGWLGYSQDNGSVQEDSAFRQAILFEHLAKISPGVAVAILVQISLGMAPIFLFGSEKQKQHYLPAAIRGETLVCLGNTEHRAGSDVASIAMLAQKVEGGWLLDGTKAYVTNGAISDYALITAVTDPKAIRNRRLSMFVVDLSSDGVTRKKLNKRVWIPSDLTRLKFGHRNFCLLDLAWCHFTRFFVTCGGLNHLPGLDFVRYCRHFIPPSSSLSR